jgi:hypothetical protein
MSERTPLEQIDAWERDGTIDEATAARLRASAETATATTTATTTATVTDAGPGAKSGGVSVVNYAIAVLLLLGGGLLFSAWQIWIGGFFGGEADTGFSALGLLFGSFVADAPQTLATYLPIETLALLGAWAMRQRDGVPGVLVAPLLLVVAYGGARTVEALVQPLIGYNLNNYENFDFFRASVINALGSGAGLGLIALLERLRPGRLLAFGFVGWSFATATSLKSVIDSLGPDGFTFWNANPLWSLWWLLPGVIIYLYARRAAALGESGRARATIARAFGGVVMILAMFLTGIGSGMVDGTGVPVGPLITTAVSFLLVLLALRERVGAYLWASAIGLFGSLSFLNALYLAGQIGELGALLVEGVLLIAIGGGVLALRSRLVSGR